MTVFGTELFFPFDMRIDQDEQLFRFKTCRLAVGCLLAYAVFRYLFVFKAISSLGIVLYYGIFYLIGGLIIGYRENIEVEKLYHLSLVAIFIGLLSIEIRQKIRDEAGRFKRNYF
tara:strand:+ start:7203 stop:7547 length:345 start_codon:yes stop_codon:yes gene_type:complete